mmetsp:Transcript_61183/g.172922  ORF Transcript_61183/g.172922 Transcript_61183/m.172922 type:complete len:133 (+) Transcript_61183:236-634(+)
MPSFPDTDSEFEEEIPFARRARTCDVGLFCRSWVLCQSQGQSAPDTASSSSREQANVGDFPFAQCEADTDDVDSSSEPAPCAPAGMGIFCTSVSWPGLELTGRWKDHVHDGCDVRLVPKRADRCRRRCIYVA